mmetsp:Transcript_666/g.1068  ORF Transcript_666/g.1068 Transcript_666/m.1068 type:complete len:98 (+) Transcript_666:1421-1714(+)
MHFNELQSGLESGQIQFREMIIRGMSYINDPKQVVLTGDQGEIVNGVLYGDFDVGFVRTDQIECTKDRVTGKIVACAVPCRPNLLAHLALARLLIVV